MNASIRIEAEIYKKDRTGEFYVKYTPVMVGGNLASGELRFAAWECPLLDGADAHRETMLKARANACNAMQTIALEVA